MGAPGSGGPIDPSFQYAPVTPADDLPLRYHGLVQRAKGFYIVTGGALTLLDDEGTPVTFTGLLGGTVVPFGSDVVMATGTSATVIALF